MSESLSLLKPSAAFSRRFIWSPFFKILPILLCIHFQVIATRFSMARTIFSTSSVLLMVAAVGVYAQCETSTETNLAVATTLSDYSQFRASMDVIYSTASDALTGATVYVWTTLEDSPEGSFTAYGVYDADALTSAGYSITTETAYITTCSTEVSATETGSLPPSPSGQVCTPHEDHCKQWKYSLS